MHRKAGSIQIAVLGMMLCLFVSVISLPAMADQSAAAQAAKKELDGTEIFQRCGFKYPGHDQRSRFIVMLRDRHGRMKRSEYIRFWKDYQGKDGVSDKMMLFNILPDEAKGAAFLRVALSGKQGKSAHRIDQWIYLPALRKIRRVSIRDPGDSFLNSNLTYADVSKRALAEDEHRLLGIRKVKGMAFYVVESVPREEKPLYGKRVFWFLKTDNWADCVNTRIDYFDHKGDLLKEQFMKWQQVNGAWVWDRVLVRSRVKLTASVFQVTDVQVDTGLSDDIFSVRTLKKGLDSIPGVNILDKGRNKVPALK